MKEKSIKVLIVDDEPDIVELLVYNLKRSFDVYSANDGNAAIKEATRVLPDIILLDIMMPGMDGIAVCRELRKEARFAKTHIIFLTARIEEHAEIAGFAAGADDYITKPVKPQTLMSRLESVVKRKFGDQSQGSKVLKIGSLSIDRGRYEVICNDQKVHLARKEFELLHLLADHPGRVFTRDEILDRVWGADVFVGDRTIDVHIRKIREKTDATFITTIKGVGYRFESPEEA